MAMEQMPPQGGDKASMVRQKLIQLLQQASKVAANNGVDFKSVIMEFMQGGGGGSPSAPPAPMRPPMGG